MELDQADQERFEDMATRLEMTSLWTEMAGLQHPGWMVVPGRSPKHWRAYPIARQRGKEQELTKMGHNLLRVVTGHNRRVFTVYEIRQAQKEALNMLKVFTHRVEA